MSDAIRTVWDFLVKGGIMMIPLAFSSLIGLAIVMAIVRHKDTTNVDEINLLKW